MSDFLTLPMSEVNLWLAIPMALLLILGGIITFTGALGLLRLPNFYQRIHGPTVFITVGTGCFLIASMLYFSGTTERPVVHELLITAFVLLTAPVVSMMIMRAAVYRDLRARKPQDGTNNAYQFPDDQ
ncbi:multisubunit potassium/proton antiporter, PhaG subunit [Halopseudomonas litoralis]|uniref:Multisubunit potassium/proton antiporter, PhaG subunit n=1 Tax=Halopseudomonas litoralis TaxID=797277 RepID=A0A1H1URV0_9GAMM|nr:monovalent cation/H(+) antiporter subunit G [Halopseudomonas litoralis]SDS75187.1 multisubunit potassium/proton antiporter, PhaG subunit [Halopseudomonas litoralis]